LIYIIYRVAIMASSGAQAIRATVPSPVRWLSGVAAGAREDCASGGLVTLRTRAFRTAIASRNRFPAARRAEFRRLPAEEVRRAAANTRAVAAHIEAAVARARRRRRGFGPLLRGLDSGLVSCDHRWRDIFRGLNRLGPEYDGCRGIALSAYLAYLHSRASELTRIYREMAGFPDGRRSA